MQASSLGICVRPIEGGLPFRIQVPIETGGWYG